MSLQVASMIEAGRGGYTKLRSGLSKQKAQFAQRIGKGRPGFPKPMNFKPIGLSSSARSQLKNLRVGTDQFLQGLIDNADYLLTEQTRLTVNEANRRQAEEIFARLDASEEGSNRPRASVIGRSGGLFDQSV